LSVVVAVFFVVVLQRQQSIDQAIKRSNERKLHRPCQSPYHNEGRRPGACGMGLGAWYMGEEKSQSMANDGCCLHSEMTKQLKN